MDFDELLTGNSHEGNYIWGIGMNLAWNELCDQVLKEKVALATEEEAALTLTRKLNHRQLTRDAIQEADLYVASGYGQETLERIRRESKAKFPEKTTETLKDLELLWDDIICFAYLRKVMEHQAAFKETSLNFQGRMVKAFSRSKLGTEGIQVLEFEDVYNFSLRLDAKDGINEIYLIKGFPNRSVGEVIQGLMHESKADPQVHAKDSLTIPNINLRYKRSYEEMIGKVLLNVKFNQYQISQMEEEIVFAMDHQGAKVENEAVIVMTRGFVPAKRELVFDRPFWLVMKEKGQQVPVLILRIENATFLEGI